MTPEDKTRINGQPEFIPTCSDELRQAGWDGVDVVIVTGDAYVDHPSFGAALIARHIVSEGFSAAIIAQPDWSVPGSLRIFGRPRLCFAVTSGNLDSSLKNYSASRRRRKHDEYSPGGITGRCPPNAAVAYANLARQAYPGVKVILGGIEVSLRRLAHYDYWQDKIRPSLLCDSKADLVVFGMAEKSFVEVLRRLRSDLPLSGIRGTARLAGTRESQQIDRSSFRMLPSFEQVAASPEALLESAVVTEEESNPFNAKTLCQMHGERALIVEPPQTPLSTEQLDRVYELPFTGAPHPSYKARIPAFDMICNSITSLRGCPGGCSFCSLALHQGRFLQSRSIGSIIREIRRLTSRECFKGTVSDIGGPTANCYSSGQDVGEVCRSCRKPSCLFPQICPHFSINEEGMMSLLESAAAQKGVSHVFVSSGIRTDVALRQPRLTAKIITDYVSGHLKVAPEHLDDSVLQAMRKNKSADFMDFLSIFQSLSAKAGKKQFIVPYFISNFPGSGDKQFEKVACFLKKTRWHLQQVQDFIPLPMTLATAMYAAEKTPQGKKIIVKKGLKARRPQIEKLKGHR